MVKKPSDDSACDLNHHVSDTTMFTWLQKQLTYIVLLFGIGIYIYLTVSRTVSKYNIHFWRYSVEIKSNQMATLKQSSFIYLYNASEISDSCNELNVSLFMQTIYQLNKITYVTRDPGKAGIFVLVFVDAIKQGTCSKLHNLPYWGNGLNHLIIILQSNVESVHLQKRWGIDFGQAVLAKSIFERSFFQHYKFRNHHDLVVPALVDAITVHNIDYKDLPMLAPIYRRFLLTFAGCMPAQVDSKTKSFYQALRNHTDTSIYLNCKPGTSERTQNEWTICAEDQFRKWTLSNATYSLVPVPMGQEKHSSWSFQVRLAEALKYGSIPVCIGHASPPFPYSEILDWRRAALVVPTKVSAVELIKILVTYSPNDVFELRRQGRHLWTSYFSTPRAILETSLLVLRNRYLIPGPPPPTYSVRGFLPNSSLAKTAIRTILSTQDLHRMGDHFHEFMSTPFQPSISKGIKITGTVFIYTFISILQSHYV